MERLRRATRERANHALEKASHASHRLAEETKSLAEGTIEKASHASHRLAEETKSLAEDTRELAAKAIDGTRELADDTVALARRLETDAVSETKARLAQAGKAMGVPTAVAAGGAGAGGETAEDKGNGEEAVSPRTSAWRTYLLLKFEGTKDAAPREDSLGQGPRADATMEELQEYKDYLLIREGVPPPGDAMPPELARYRVVQPAILRRGFAKDSHRHADVLPVGGVIEVVERVVAEDGTVRLRCERGWASEKASDG
jgi:hypothetical protein